MDHRGTARGDVGVFTIGSGFFLCLILSCYVVVTICSTFYSQTISLDMLETRLLGNSTFDALRYKDLNVFHSSGSLRLFRVRQLPPLALAPIALTTDNRTIADNQYQHLTYHLNQGSQIKLKLVSNVELNVLLIRGASAFRKWEGESDFYNLIGCSNDIILTRTVTATQHKAQFAYVLPAVDGGGGGDDYFIVFHNFAKFSEQPAVVSFSLVRFCS